MPNTKKIIVRPETARLLEVIEILERTHTASDIADKLDIYASNLSDLKKGHVNAGNKLIQKFTKKYFVNNNWLFTGEGDMFLGQNKPHNEKSINSEAIWEEIKLLKRKTVILQMEYTLLCQEINTLENRIKPETQKS